MIKIEVCERLGWLYGKLAAVAKPTAGAYGRDMMLPVIGCTQLHKQLAAEGKLTPELIDACTEVFGNLPADVRPTEQANMEGQSAFVLWYHKARAGADCPPLEDAEPDGLKLREARIAVGMSQKDAAEAAGLTAAALSRIESGKAVPRESTIRKLVEIYEKQDSQQEETL